MKEVLQICPELLFDNLDQAQPIQCVPLWDLIGEIIYGEYISVNHDSCLCSTYLESFDEVDFKSADLIPGFPSQTNCNIIEEYNEYVLRGFTEESPYLFGPHPNAEFGSIITQTNFFFRTLMNV
jgi:dynein heavy chain